MTDSDGAANRMQDLIDAGDIEGLLAAASIDEIARAWHRYNAAPTNQKDGHPDWWAVDLWYQGAFLEDGELRRTMILKLLEHADDDAIGSVAAGPLEDFLSDDEDDVRWIETEARTNAALRRALTGVWISTDVTESTFNRIEAAAGAPLPRPRPRSEWSPELVALVDAQQKLEALTEHRSDDGSMAVSPEEFTAAADVFEAALRAATEPEPT